MREPAMITLRPRLLSAIAALAACLSLPAMSSAAGPDFDAVTWQQLGCDSPDLIVGASPSAVSFVGNQANMPAFYAYDADYLYFRYRMDSDPRQGGSGFQQFVWTALMQVPSGNRFQYQYQLSLNGKANPATVEIWQNTVASNIRFPHFQDDAEVKLYSAPVASLARAVPAGTSFNGNADWFVDFAFPVQTMIANGVISNAADLGQSFFFPATSTNPNNYSKSYLNCPFQPYTTLTIQKSVAPAAASANALTPVVYTIEVTNPMGPAVGVVIQDPTLPAFFNTVAASATSDDPGAALTVVSTNPLQVTTPTLGAGKHVTVQLTANAEPGCSDGDFVNTAAAYATNSLERDASATLNVQAANGPEICDGKDNNCNGQVDEGANLCDDGNVCTIDTCGGASGCSHEWIPGCVPCQTAADCDDGNVCNGVETCDPATGCHAGTPLSCDDGNGCNGVKARRDVRPQPALRAPPPPAQGHRHPLHGRRALRPRPRRPRRHPALLRRRQRLQRRRDLRPRYRLPRRHAALLRRRQRLQRRRDLRPQDRLPRRHAARLRRRQRLQRRRDLRPEDRLPRRYPARLRRRQRLQRRRDLRPRYRLPRRHAARLRRRQRLQRRRDL